MLIVRSTFSSQMWLYYAIFHSKEQELIEEVADSRAGAGKAQEDHKTSCFSRKHIFVKNCEGSETLSYLQTNKSTCHGSWMLTEDMKLLGKV